MELTSGKILAVWVGHNQETLVHTRISTNVGDASSWEADSTITTPANATYSQLHRLGSTIVLIVRSTHWRYCTSTDEGETWSSWTTLLTGSSPYMVSRSNGSRIDCLVTQTSPNLGAGSIGHIYTTDGATWRESDGTALSLSIQADDLLGTSSEIDDGLGDENWIGAPVYGSDSQPHALLGS